LKAQHNYRASCLADCVITICCHPLKLYWKDGTGPGVPWFRPVAASLTPPGSALSCKFVGHESGVHAVAVTPDGRYAVSGSFDKTLRLWELNTGKFIRNFEGHAGTVFGAAVTPDGQRIVSGSSDGTLRVWDLNTAKLINTLSGHTGKIYAVKITLDGRYIISSSADRTLSCGIWIRVTGAYI